MSAVLHVIAVERSFFRRTVTGEETIRGQSADEKLSRETKTVERIILKFPRNGTVSVREENILA